MALLLELVGGPNLTECRPLDRHLHYRLLDRRLDAVLLDWLPARHLRQCKVAALLVELLKAIETIAAVSHDLAGLRNAAELLGQFQQGQPWL